MDKELRIAELISKDIRSRANANIIRSEMDGVEGNIKLNFEEVQFISRSFADELFSLVKENENISLESMTGIVKSMYETVKKARESKRVFNETHSQVKEFDDIESLSSYLVQW
ncbi:MAG: hypothetical protein LUC91_10955 [Prevotella sp.]|nr:hypothetical protein [Prevotella sp.]